MHDLSPQKSAGDPRGLTAPVPVDTAGWLLVPAVSAYASCNPVRNQPSTFTQRPVSPSRLDCFCASDSDSIRCPVKPLRPYGPVQHVSLSSSGDSRKGRGRLVLITGLL